MLQALTKRRGEWGRESTRSDELCIWSHLTEFWRVACCACRMRYTRGSAKRDQREEGKTHTCMYTHMQFSRKAGIRYDDAAWKVRIQFWRTPFFLPVNKPLPPPLSSSPWRTTPIQLRISEQRSSADYESPRNIEKLGFGDNTDLKMRREISSRWSPVTRMPSKYPNSPVTSQFPLSVSLPVSK